MLVMTNILMITDDYDGGRDGAPGDTGGCPWQRATWRKESLCLGGESIIGVNEDDIYIMMQCLFVCHEK